MLYEINFLYCLVSVTVILKFYCFPIGVLQWYLTQWSWSATLVLGKAFSVPAFCIGYLKCRGYRQLCWRGWTDVVLEPTLRLSHIQTICSLSIADFNNFCHTKWILNFMYLIVSKLTYFYTTYIKCGIHAYVSFFLSNINNLTSLRFSCWRGSPKLFSGVLWHSVGSLATWTRWLNAEVLLGVLGSLALGEAWSSVARSN